MIVAPVLSAPLRRVLSSAISIAVGGGGGGGVTPGQPEAQARAVQALRTTGRGLLSPRPAQNGYAFKDRAMTQPWVYPWDLEQPALAVIPVSAVPPGVLPWSLGPDLLGGAGAMNSATGWGTTGSGSPVLSFTGGVLTITANNGAANYGVAWFNLGTLTAGKTYNLRLGFATKFTGAGNIRATISTQAPGAVGTQPGTPWAINSASATLVQASAEVTVSSTGTHYLYLWGQDTLVTNSYSFDSVTVQEVIYDWTWLGPNLAGNPLAINQAPWGTLGTLSSVTSNSFTNSSGAGAGRRIVSGIVAGKTYRFSVSYTKSDSTTLFSMTLDTGGSTTASSTAATGTLSGIAAAAGTGHFYLRLAGNATITFTEITVQEIPAYPLVAPTAGGVRPSGRVNLLQRTRDISHSAWTKDAGGTGSAPIATKDYAVAPDGTLTACRVQFDRGAGTTVSDFSRFFQFIGGTEERKATVYLKSNTAQNYTLQLVAGSNTATVVAGQSWAVVNLTGVSSTNFTLRLVGSVGTNVTADVLVWDTDLRSSVYTTSAYPVTQRVNDGTAGVYDYDATGFPVWCAAAASNAGLHTVGTLDLSATDAARMGAVVAKLSDSTQSILGELSASSTSNNGVIALATNTLSTGGGTGYSFRSRGIVVSDLVTSGSAAPHVAALNARSDISDDVATMLVNAASSSSASDQGSGNYGNYRFYAFGRNLDGTPALSAFGIARLATWVPHIVDANSVSEADFAALIREDAAAVGLTY